jgi:hypothetical protein
VKSSPGAPAAIQPRPAVSPAATELPSRSESSGPLSTFAIARWKKTALPALVMPLALPQKSQTAPAESAPPVSSPGAPTTSSS